MSLLREEYKNALINDVEMRWSALTSQRHSEANT